MKNQRISTYAAFNQDVFKRYFVSGEQYPFTHWLRDHFNDARARPFRMPPAEGYELDQLLVDLLPLLANGPSTAMAALEDGLRSELDLLPHSGDTQRLSSLPNAKITFDKFHVIKLVNNAVDEVRRQERHTNTLLKGTRYLWLKTLENLSDTEKQSLASLEGANLDTTQAWQMRLNLQDVFKMTNPASAAKFLARWHAWVKISELKPMIKAANTIMSRSSEILRAITSKLSNGLLEAINGNVQAAKRKAKGYRTKRNLKMIIYLIAGDLLDLVPT